MCKIISLDVNSWTILSTMRLALLRSLNEITAFVPIRAIFSWYHNDSIVVSFLICLYC